MKIHAAARTDIGLVRSNNEDNYYMDEKAGLFVVADGMGGHASGEVASKMAVDIIRDYITGGNRERPAQFGAYREDCSETTNHLGSAIRLANMAIYEASRKNVHMRGMGTTIAAAHVDDRRLSIAHIGDSRVYLVRAGDIEQLTDDHTVVYEQVKREMITKEEATRSQMRHVLTKALGISAEAEVDLDEMNLAPDDSLLLCSDGLNSMVDDETMRTVIEAADDPATACDQLISLANARGGKDNITVVVVRIEGNKRKLSFISNILRWFRR